MDFRHKIDDVVETLQNAKGRDRKCSLLIGAGCSVKAGIPTAQGFVEVIKKRYRQAYSRAKEKTYPHCMHELSFGERRDLIAEYVDKAKINWAHIAIAQLIANGFVDRVLTTNFDPLVVRACGLVNVFPAVYDFAASQLFSSADIPDQAVFHLHGQRSGFAIMNTEEECKRHSDLLRPVFEDAGKGRVWLVVGYSGENDPVFDHLAEVQRFDNRLYWIGYQKDEPPKHVRERLLLPDRYAFYVNGYDADGFFITLARKLKCFPPGFCARPFSHLESCLERITVYAEPGQQSDIDVTLEARKMIRLAKEQHEQDGNSGKRKGKGRTASPAELMEMVMAGNYEEAIARGMTDGKLISDSAADAVSWAYVLQGEALRDQAKAATGEEADRLFALAEEKYEAAIKIKPDKHEALYNWGLALQDQADTKTGDAADRMLALACKKYESAIKLKADHFEALSNLGAALIDRAKTKSGDVADQLFALARQKCEAALNLKRDDVKTLNNWTISFIEAARKKPIQEAHRLIGLAEEKAIQTESVLTGYGAYNLACICALQGREDDCRRWLEQARDCGFLPSRAHLASDIDLDSVRDKEWFREFLAGLQ